MSCGEYVSPGLFSCIIVRGLGICDSMDLHTEYRHPRASMRANNRIVKRDSSPLIRETSLPRAS